MFKISVRPTAIHIMLRVWGDIGLNLLLKTTQGDNTQLQNPIV